MHQMAGHARSYLGLVAITLMLVLAAVSYGQPFEETKLVASDGTVEDRFGNCVSISGDRAVVGANFSDALGEDSGAAYVFHWDGSQWNQVARLVASDGTVGDRFGYWVSISGNRLVVGALYKDALGENSGAAYVFEWDGNSWEEQTKLLPVDGAAGDEFGTSVSISGDRIVVGSHFDGDQGTDSGSAYVFEWDGNSWEEQAKLVASDGAPEDYFGQSLSISGDRLVVGAHGADNQSANSGSAYVFEWDGNSWEEQTKLIASDSAENDDSAFSVSMQGDRIVVGSHFDDDQGTDSGSAYVFEWDGNSWEEQTKLTASDGAAGDEFGIFVSMDGNRIAVGTYRDDDQGTDSGSAYVFEWDGNSWEEQAKLTASDGASNDYFGATVSVSGDRVLGGAPWNDDWGVQSGSAYVFSLSPGTPQPVTIWMPDTTTSYGETLIVPVRVNDTTNKEVVSAEAVLAYDSDLLTAISSSPSGTLLTDGWSIETNIIEGVGAPIDTLKMAMATDDDVLSGAGTLINITFQVANIRHPASSPLELTHVLFNNGTPDYMKTDGSVTLVGTDGIVTSLPSEILPRWSIEVSVYDIDEDRNAGVRDALDVGIANGSQTETLTVTETGSSTGVFSGVISTAFSLSFTSDDGIVQAKAGDQILFSYADSLDSNGDTQTRTAATDVLGGTDGQIRATVVSQPGDTVRVRVSDADLSDAVAVSVANPRTGETESILLSQFTSGESHFYGRFFTAAQAGAVGDSTLEAAKGDVLSITYADTLTEQGGTATVMDADEVVDPFGDAHPNGSVQAFDAAQVLIHRLSTYGGGAGTLSGLDSLSANLDQGAPFGIIDGYDASLILRKVVGLISRFEVQEPDAVNHPQPETATRPKPVPEERQLALVPGEGYVSVWMEDRREIVSGELTLAGVQGQVVMGEELKEYLSASQVMEDGLQVVFAGSEAVSGAGELLRIAGVGPGDARLTRVSFNGSRIGARWEENAASVAVPASFALYPNVPNPFNPETVIRFALARESQVRLEVFDVVGQRVLVLVGEQLPAGAHQALWDGRGKSGERVSSGVYFCRLQAEYAGGEFSQVGRMLLLK